MVPTKERAPSSVYAEYRGYGILFDCGEGTQRQMNINRINRNQVKLICISHWHADHVAGLPGLLQTINSANTEQKIVILGPNETKNRVQQFMGATIFDDHLDIECIECDMNATTKSYETADFEIWTTPLVHSTPVIGFSFVEKDKRRVDNEKKSALGLKDGPHLAQLQQGQSVEVNGKMINPDEVTFIEKGKKITYITDTLFCPNAITLAEGSDLLICESTYGREHAEKAEQYKHMTSSQAAQIASMSGSKKLVLTHFSQRYKQVDALLTEAKEIFVDTQAAYDFMKIKI